MGGLQVLEAKYKDQGFRTLGFYSNDFGNQGGNEAQIEACIMEHMVTFMQFEIAPVTGPNTRPVFAWLYAQPNPGPKPDPIEPSWNFHKYLVSRTGELVATFGQGDIPGDDPDNPDPNGAAWASSPMVIAIEAELAK